MHLARFPVVAFLIAGAICCYSQGSASRVPQLQLRSYPSFDGVPMEPRCADIEQKGAAFNSLAQVCEYALSPQSLPNLICQQTTQRFAGDIPIDVVTDKVTFYQGHDSYSDFIVDGRPLPGFNWQHGWGSNALFGSLLHSVFYPPLETRFKLATGRKNLGIEFSAFKYFMPESRAPGFDVDRANPSMSGTIWVNEHTKHLARIDMLATRVDQRFPLRSYHSAIDYADLPIEDLGTVLLPVKAAVQACFARGLCYRNIVNFHDCQKFASKARILTDPVK